MNVENIVKSIDALAPLSDAILDIQKLYSAGQEELDINKLISFIESDSLLSLNILKMANSPIYGFSTRIASVSQAVTLFGIMQVYGFVMKYAVSENIKAKTEIFGFSNERFNDICNIQSALLLQWYSKIDLEDARFLAPLALIMETGKLVIANEVSVTSYEKEFEEGFRKSKDSNNYEKLLIGTTSYELSSMVFKHWHLEPLYIRILKELQEKDEASETLRKYIQILNIVLSAVNLKSILSKASVLKACTQVKEMGLNPNAFAKVALNVKRAYISELKVRQEKS
ncbi:HDOD domain-containing protein [Sulfurimonas sp.]|uniref:HDOD domain-containing protein n=1 Tax=Sulfurimonas sp. TaxID=2022749 RepID=UPI0039E2EF40